MSLILILLGLLFPRIVVAVLYFVTNWFSAAFDGILIPLLGFIFMPLTLLWYAVVMHFFSGAWSIIPIAGMVLAIAADLGVLRQSRRK